MTTTTTNTNTITPTIEQYTALEYLFYHFNKELFNSRLPSVLLTLSKHNKAKGYFIPKHWSNTAQTEISEIALNPDYFYERTAKEITSTLVHEMCHLQQETDGTAPRRCYHNKDFADKMQAVGLITSSTGKEGGKRTGQNMTHYIEAGGKFEQAFEKLNIEKIFLPWQPTSGKEVKPKAPKKKKEIIKYTCPICNETVKGKKGLNLKCVECDEFLLPSEF